MTPIVAPQQRQVVVAVVSRYRLVALGQHFGAAVGVEHPQHSLPQTRTVVLLRGSQYLAQHLDEILGSLPVSLAQLLESLLASVVELAHALDEHLHQRIACLGPSLHEQT